MFTSIVGCKRCRCLLLSEDLDEIMLLSDTIGVINRGRITAEFNSPADRQKIGKAMVN